MTKSTIIYPDLKLIDNLVFKTCGLELSNVKIELESQEYAACDFELGRLKVKFRTAKNTPVKIGQFVTIWKRNENGITQPFDLSDNIDFYLISSRLQNKFGLFVFPKSILHDHEILSGKTSRGKRGIRVYPAWDLTTNKQSQKTQQWQAKYFLEISHDKLIDIKKAKLLFKIDS